MLKRNHSLEWETEENGLSWFCIEYICPIYTQESRLLLTSNLKRRARSQTQWPSYQKWDCTSEIDLNSYTCLLLMFNFNIIACEKNNLVKWIVRDIVLKIKSNNNQLVSTYSKMLACALNMFTWYLSTELQLSIKHQANHTLNFLVWKSYEWHMILAAQFYWHLLF